MGASPYWRRAGSRGAFCCQNAQFGFLHFQWSFFAYIRQEKRAQRLTFGVRRPPGGVRVLRSRKARALPRNFVFLGFRRENLGCPRNFAGMSRTPGGVQKVCAKSSCALFVPYYSPLRRFLDALSHRKPRSSTVSKKLKL